LKINNEQMKIILGLLLVFSTICILQFAPEVFSESGGVGNADREYECAGSSCHNKGEYRSSSTITMNASKLDLETGEEVTVEVTVTGAEEDDPDALMGVFLVRRLETSDSLPSVDGWEAISDPGGSTTYNYHEKTQEGDGGTWTWTLKAPMEPGTYYLYAREHHNNGEKHWQDDTEGLTFTVSDTTPPSAITDLATSDPSADAIALSWTAPGDDRDNGTASGYVVRYSTDGEITEENWSAATNYTQDWEPLPAGKAENHDILGLDNDTRYWFAIKAYDDAGNHGGISNSPHGATTNEPAETKGPVNLTLTPVIGSLRGDEELEFTLSVEYDGKPLDNVTLTITTQLGTIHGKKRVSTGVYVFTYSAPAVSRNISEAMSVTAERRGYETAHSNLIFSVLVNDTGPGRDDEQLDGVIAPGEYEFSSRFKGGNFVIYWRVEGDAVHFAMVGKTSGWVSLGLGPGKAMKDADMYIGWVTNGGEVFLVDAYSTGAVGPHPPDTDLGGTDDILAYGGIESNGFTVIEFKRLLVTGDRYDKNIPAYGRVNIIWATGPSDGFNTMHQRDGSGRLDFGTGESKEDDDVELWPLHAGPLGAGLASMAAAVLIAVFYRKKGWWLRAHRTCGLLGAALSVSGLAVGIYMVEDSTGEHFRVPHAYLGLVTIILLIMTPAIRYIALRHREKMAKMMRVHRWAGRATLLLMLLAVITGLFAAGVL